MSRPFSETAYAKINLALHVRRRRDDGYHELETIFAFAEDGDALSAEPGPGLRLDITGPFAAELTSDQDNLVMRAARALQAAFGIATGAWISLDKRLPVASGIGGGSADAAATLRLLARLWGIDPETPIITAIARDLGADVPACLTSRPVIGTGRGDDLEPFAGVASGTALLLVNPSKPLATAPVFDRWDGVDRGALDAGDATSWRNDLTAPATALVPEVATNLQRLETLPGVTTARMSGSGATCFALFDSNATRDAAALHFSDQWVMPTRLR